MSAAGGVAPGEQAIPVLRVRDAGTSVAWYRRLGFEPEWERRFGPGFPAFVSIARGHVRLFLSEHLGDTVPRSVVYLRLADLEALSADLGAVPEETDWQTREITLHDPDGNRVRVGVLAHPGG
jgi:catechol 2,3-dioxygenase-like lactoylglutathione lyase family enzyme